MKYPTKVASALCCSALTVMLASCGDSNSNNTVQPPVQTPAPVVTFQYEIQLTNLSQAQPISPIAAVIQATGTLWSIGQPASVALERLAEGGNNSEILNAPNVIAKASATGALAAGATTKITLETTQLGNRLSIVGMPENTNDAFTGLTGYDLSTLPLGGAESFDVIVYDAGTEANSESAATVPGPAAGGQGFNSERDDVNQVRMHSGVVSQDDGLSSSALNESQRFDNPMLRVRINRTK